MLPDPAFDLVPGEALDPGEAKPEGTTVFGTLDRRQERRFPGSAPAAFAASPFPAPVGVIDLDGPVQRAVVVPFLHDLEDLVLQQPRGVVGDPQLALQFQGRHGVLALGQEIDLQEPDGERQLGAGEEGAGSQRGLVPTVVALVATVEKDTEPVALAGRAPESLRSAPQEQGMPALFLRSVPTVEFGETEPFLKLDPILGHDPLHDRKSL